MNATQTELMEGFLAKACNDLTWVHRCTDGGLWGQAHAIAASSVQMALCACLVLKARLPDAPAAVERTFRDSFEGAAQAIDVELARMSDLRQRLDHTPFTPFTDRDWGHTRDGLARILETVVGLLPRDSVGRRRVDAARELLMLPRAQEFAEPQPLMRLA